jgi:alkylation response protein AidB-like acyl-CoA dehydrogenase
MLACYTVVKGDFLLIHVSQVEKFVEEECIPADAVYLRQIGETTKQRFEAHPSIIEDLKKRARELGLWNMFLPKAHFKEGAGFSNLEYGLMAEYLGKSRVASEVCVLFISFPRYEEVKEGMRIEETAERDYCLGRTQG